ncbi:histidinol-phosphate aminotransferase family protein [Deinococcus psychrotolerans]|uniref:Histidinol-phosphate aminotransferase n=1 Tax=Deinococcus psychrotolerans TaxID=2489213 RepID=A0A3G8YD92_9DEIO|nr:histidinol-phosphate transaminase [Deinococcus psychrotolerans]AZI43282.1 histidinol-phosphate aminotransferase family protein [Deinococcus psychrotolerans]
MTSTPMLPASALSGVRQVVRRTPAYPFTPVSAAIKLDQNESALDLPAELRDLALQRLAHTEWNRYPDLHADTLRDKIAEFEDWNPDGVVVTPGSNVLIKLLTEMAGVNQRVLSVQPNFSVYGLEASMLGATLLQVPLKPDFSLPVEGLVAELQKGGPGLLFVTQPHAPTGHLDAESDVKAVLDAAGDDWVAVLDEAYYQFADSDGRALVAERSNRISLRTCSKAWGLAGLRLGYALTSPELAQNLQKLVSAFNINILTQTVAMTALEHPEYMRQRVAQTVQERQRILAALQGHPVYTGLPSQGNFFLLKTPDAAAAYQHLLSRGLLVRRQDGMPMLEGCLRIGIGTPEQNSALLAALAEVTG